MKFTYLAGLAILPFAWAAVVPETGEVEPSEAPKPDVQNAQSTIHAAELEGSVAALIHQLAMTVDNALSADAAARQVAPPVSINAIIDKIYMNDDTTRHDHGAAVEQATNIINSAGSNASQTVGNSVDGVQDFIGGDVEGGAKVGENTLNAGDIMRGGGGGGRGGGGGYLDSIPKALLDILNGTDGRQIQEFTKKFKAALEYMFQNFGTGSSPVEQLINNLIGTFHAFLVNVEEHADSDPQVILHEQLEAMLNHLHEGVHPIMRAYVMASDIPEADVAQTVEVLTRNFVSELSNITGALERTMGDFLHRTEPKDVIGALIRIRVIRTIGEVALEFIKAIAENARATNYMLHLANSAEGAYRVAKNHIEGIENGLITEGPLYTLLTDKNEMEKMITGLERTYEPLADTLGNLVYTFLITIPVPDYIMKPEISSGLSEENRRISAMDLWFKAAEKVVANIQKQSPFVGLLLKKVLAFAETVYKDDPKIISNSPSIANSIAGMQAIIDGFIAFLKAKQLE